MHVSLNKKWLQNIGVVLLVIGVLVGMWFTRPVIEAYTRPEFFFITVSVAVILLGINILLSLFMGKRVNAIADSRTADLLETQKLFVELYRNSPVPYVMIDHSGRVTFPNHAALHLFGLQSESFEGKNIFDMFEALDDEGGMHGSLIRSRFSQGVFVEARDVLIYRADGGTRFGLLSIFPYGAFGSQKKGLMTIVDITKQKEIEQAKTEFVSIASHQLRTPISSMKWNLELLKSPQFGTLTEQQQEYYVKIARNLTKMNVLIDDFLNVSQLELGTKQVKVSEIELRSFFESICEEFDGRVAEKGLTLQKQFDERIKMIETDVSLLHMAVSNLVSNATKYTPEEGTVTIQYSAGNETISISICDNGVGIPAQDIDKLFTKFFRAENVRQQVTEGTGLGLYIVKLAIESIGGTISVHSVEGEGTAFSIVLPRSAPGHMVK